MSTTAEEDLFQSVDYLDALEDVHTRFLLNLPESELETADRIFFQLEQAWWFYEDWICDPQPDVKRPRFSTFKPFAQQLFAYSPLLPDVSNFQSMWNEFTQYKRKISNYGCILLSADYKKLVLCQLWNSKTHTLPAGKINQGETGAVAAARETYEETGFDPTCTFGLTGTWKQDDADRITWNYRSQDKDAIVVQEDNGKQRTCFVVDGVPEDFPFQPVARKEVSSVSWHPVDQIPKPSYAVQPFLPHLKKWIKKQQRMTPTRDYQVTPSRSGSDRSDCRSIEAGMDGSGSRSGSSRSSPTHDRSNKRGTGRKRTPRRDRTSSRGRTVSEDDDLVLAGLAHAGGDSGWSEEAMFQANEKLIGRKIEYDGNPHLFAEQGFGGRDPHSFHVVGGSFLNSCGISSLAPPPERSKLQPLFRKESTTNDDGLTPFFSEDGCTPWGEIVEEIKDLAPAPVVSRMANPDDGGLLEQVLKVPALPVSDVPNDGMFSNLILTDVEITQKSQEAKNLSSKQTVDSKREALLRQYEDDMVFIRHWVSNLPKPPQTKFFGTFRLDADAIVAACPSLQGKHNGK